MPMPTEQFDRLRDQYYRAWFRFNPEVAVDVGVPGYADRLAPYATDDIGALISLDESLLAGLDELDPAALDPDRAIDFALMRGSALLELEELIEFDWRHRDPQRYLPLNAIHQLTIREVEAFPAALRARLAAVPGYLHGARHHLSTQAERIPPVWLEAAVTAAEDGVGYVRDLPEHPKVRAGPADGLGELVAAAAEALHAYARFLEEHIAPRASGDFAWGARRFGHLLSYRHFLDVTPAAVHALGEQLVTQTVRDLKRACRDLAGHEDVDTVVRSIQARHPRRDHVLTNYRVGMQAARAFVSAQDLVTMPQPEHLDVVDTPPFLRHQIPFAAYVDPMPDDPRQQGYYYVTPPADGKGLAAHNEIELLHTCVHEAYPGHHLQFVTANRNITARSLPRLLNPSATLFEGWALYCEQLMHEQGFLNGHEHELMLLKDRLWRALRIVIDTEIHTGRRSFDGATGLLQKHLGFTPAQAMGELTWYSQSPAVPMGYATGWAMINAARDRLRAERPELTLRAFHDRLLSCGSIALPLVLRRAFGDDLERRVHDMLFTPPPAGFADER